MTGNVIRFCRRSFAAIAVAMFLGAPVASATCDGNWVITDLGSLGGNAGATALNEGGQVAGNSGTAYGAERAFLWDNGVMLDLGGFTARAFGINNRGDVVGDSILYYPGAPRHAYLYRNGTMQPIDTGEGSSIAYDINDAGQVVGKFERQPSSGDSRAFLFHNGTLQDLSAVTTPGGEAMRWASAINNRGQVVGTGGSTRAFLYSNGTVTDIDVGSAYAHALDISDRGWIVGHRSNPGELLTGFLYVDGVVTSIGPAGTIPNAVNNRGQIVGSITRYPDLPEAFLYVDGTFIRLNTLPEVTAAGWHLQSAEDINSRGQIVGIGLRQGFAGNRAFMLSPACGPAR